MISWRSHNNQFITFNKIGGFLMPQDSHSANTSLNVSHTLGIQLIPLETQTTQALSYDRTSQWQKATQDHSCTLLCRHFSNHTTGKAGLYHTSTPPKYRAITLTQPPSRMDIDVAAISTHCLFRLLLSRGYLLTCLHRTCYTLLQHS